jgi:glycerophosphoryl diester phosphodiesterase
VVVHHDPVTNARPGDAGPVLRIADALASDLRSFHAGGERVPTLPEVLAIVPHSRVVYVEIKAPGIERHVVEAIRAGHRRCAVHSFDHRIVRRVSLLAPEIPLGILQTSYPVDPLRPVRDAGARDLWQHWELLDEELVQRVHEDGRRIIAWTVNDPAVADRFVGWGVDGICTDVPAIMQPLASAPPR